ncbi:MAG: hypothetical protein COB38_05880 [Gammaproteobacteria bacterium]|nr:MAG: hypothetical protein COB38_05880 [Gammaproteobacteria bacterium]
MKISKEYKQQVIVLHGLGRLPRSMRKLESCLIRDGFHVLNIGYPSHSDDFESILSQVIDQVKVQINPNLQIHFIGHSFGGLMIRGLLANKEQWLARGATGLENSRCVMLGTPNKGTSIAKFMTDHTVPKYVTPRVSIELVPNSQLINTLPEPNIETGIIAGNKPFIPWIPVTWFYKKASANAPGDGVVEVSSTQCSNMSDFIVMPLHHSFMMWDSQLIEQSIHFLKNGCFVNGILNSHK